jgi:two-component SAPR family response regulator
MSKLKPLYVDDSSCLRELVEVYFNDIDKIRIRTTGDEREALDLVQRGVVNLIIIQFDLRPISGEIFFNAVRHVAPELPCVFVSSYPPCKRLNELLLEAEGVRVVFKDDFGGKFLPSLYQAVLDLCKE